MGNAVYIQITGKDEHELPSWLVYHVRSHEEAQFIGKTGELSDVLRLTEYSGY